MQKMDEKVSMIGSSIVSQARQERDAIVSKAIALREKELAACKEALIETMFSRVQTQTRAVRQNTIREKAKAELGAYRQLLTQREALTAAVFAEATVRLREYTATEEYRSALGDGLKSMREKWDHSSSTVFFRQADMGLESKARQLLPGCKVEADPTIRIGGFRLLNEAEGILVDETLDARLEDQKPWFLMNCGLKTG